MSGSCRSISQSPAGPSICPRCRQKGRPVDGITVKALLRASALELRAETAHRFCPTAQCPVVYFGGSEIFTVKDIAVPVFQKEPPGNRLVCHCFDVTEKEIRQELAETGQSTVQKRITALVKAGRCACELRNPQGTCCLGNIATAVQDVRKDLEDRLAGCCAGRRPDEATLKTAGLGQPLT